MRCDFISFESELFENLELLRSISHIGHPEQLCFPLISENESEQYLEKILAAWSQKKSIGVESNIKLGGDIREYSNNINN